MLLDGRLIDGTDHYGKKGGESREREREREKKKKKSNLIHQKNKKKQTKNG